jgi:hypothetical protein
MWLLDCRKLNVRQTHATIRATGDTLGSGNYHCSLPACDKQRHSTSLPYRARFRTTSTLGRVPNSGVGAVGKWPAAATGEGLA